MVGAVIRNGLGRPTPVAGALAVAFALAAPAVIEPTATVGGLLALVVTGLGALAVASHQLLCGRRVVATAAGVAGVGVVAVTVASAVRVLAVATVLEVVPGLVGAVLVGAAILPAGPVDSRTLLRAGTGAVLAGVLVAGVLRDATLDALLVGTVACVLAWDAGEHAVGLGEQVGRQRGTTRAELAHAGGSLLVGAVAILAGRVAAGIGPTTGSLSNFLLLVVAVVALAFALYV